MPYGLLLLLACMCAGYMPLFVSSHVLPQSDGERLHVTEFQRIQQQRTTTGHQTQPEQVSHHHSSHRDYHGNRYERSADDQWRHHLRSALKTDKEVGCRLNHVHKKSADLQNRANSAFGYYCRNVKLPDPSDGLHELDRCERFIASSDTQRNLRLPEVYTFDCVETVAQLSTRMSQVLQAYEDYKAVLRWILRTRENRACSHRRRILWQRCNAEILCEGRDDEHPQMALYCDTVDYTQSILFALRQLKHVHGLLMSSLDFEIPHVEADVEFPPGDIQDFALNAYTTGAYYQIYRQAHHLRAMTRELCQLRQETQAMPSLW